MKQRRSFKPVTYQRRKQAGDALLEAMIAMLLAMVVGLGPVYVASRGAVVQTQAAYKNMAVVEMRNLLASQGPALCVGTHRITVGTRATPAIPAIPATSNTPAIPAIPAIPARSVLDLPVIVTCTDRPVSGITIGGQAVNPSSSGSGSAKTISLSIGSSGETKFGGGGIITITQGGA